jgi:hypothetical protein
MWGVASVAFVCGCGGTVTESAAGDSGSPEVGPPVDSSPGDDSSSTTDVWGVPPDGGPWSPVCPESAPALGSPCTHDQLECEYGSAW